MKAPFGFHQPSRLEQQVHVKLEYCPNFSKTLPNDLIKIDEKTNGKILKLSSQRSGENSRQYLIESISTFQK